MAELKMDFAKMADGFTKTAKEKEMFVSWWIPVSERLPEEGKEVLVSGYDTDNKMVIISRYQGEQYGFTCGLVSAWMPLPQPYKGESEDAEC